MERINLFKKHLEEKRAVKIIAGIDNFDMESVKRVVTAADKTGASAVDICADEDIIKDPKKYGLKIVKKYKVNDMYGERNVFEIETL